MAGGHALLDDALDKAHVNVAAGEQAHHVFALDIDLAVQDRRDRRCASGLHDHLAALHQKQDRVGDLGVGDRDHAVAVIVDDAHRDVAGGLDRNAVGNGGGGGGGDKALFPKALGDGVGSLGLHAVDFYAGVHLLDGGNHPGQQPAAARGGDDHIHRRQVAEDFKAQRALPGDDLEIVVGVQEGRALLLADFAGFGVGVVVHLARQHDPGPVVFGGLDLGDGGVFGHDDGGRDAEGRGRAGHALGVVPGGGGNHGTALPALDHGGELIGRAADLERAGLLPVFTFEIDIAAGHAGEGGGEVQLRMVQDGL